VIEERKKTMLKGKDPNEQFVMVN